MMNNEKDILSKLINADEKAFREIYILYVKEVYHFIYGHIKNKTEAEDITQNVFIKIWEKKKSIDINQSFGGFIFTIAYRAVLDYFKLASTKQINSQKYIFSDLAVASSNNSDDLLNKHQLESVYEKALQLLPPKRKEIFLLSRHSGLSNKQIADKLGISVKTVENQMTSALASLKEFFKASELSLPLFIFTSLFLG